MDACPIHPFCFAILIALATAESDSGLTSPLGPRLAKSLPISPGPNGACPFALCLP